jgi:hypothetical protein
VISLQEFSSEWTLEVVATVPESYDLQSLSVNILHGSVRTEGVVGMLINNLRVDLCNGADNSVTLDGLKMDQVASICATDSIKISNAQLGTACHWKSSHWLARRQLHQEYVILLSLNSVDI